MLPGQIMLNLTEEILASPGYTLSQQLKTFAVTVFTLDGNYEEFRRYIELLVSEDAADQLLPMRNRDQLDGALVQTIRLLHNFVAAAFSLVDHTRRVYRKLNSDAKPFPDYQSRLESELAKDPLVQFVQDLRNHCIHRNLPSMGYSVNVTNEACSQVETLTVTLSKVELLGFEKWSPLAKQFLAGQPDEIDILDVATTYRNKVMAFTNWFLWREREIYAEELSRLREKEVLRATIRLEAEVDVFLAGVSALSNKEEVFLGILTSAEFAALEATPPDSEERARAALALVQAQFPLSSALQDKIMRLFTGRSA
jgi:hypothetical protein